MTPRQVYHREVRKFKTALLAHYLAAHKGNVSATARALGLQRTHLAKLLREAGLNRRTGPTCPLHPTTVLVRGWCPACRGKVGGQKSSPKKRLAARLNAALPRPRKDTP